MHAHISYSATYKTSYSRIFWVSTFLGKMYHAGIVQDKTVDVFWSHDDIWQGIDRCCVLKKGLLLPVSVYEFMATCGSQNMIQTVFLMTHDWLHNKVRAKQHNQSNAVATCQQTRCTSPNSRRQKTVWRWLMRLRLPPTMMLWLRSSLFRKRGKIR